MKLAQDFGPLHEGFQPGVFQPEICYVRQGNRALFFVGTPTQINESVEAEGLTLVESINDLELEERRSPDGQPYKDVKNGEWVVEGPFQRSDVKNANGRTYSKKIWERIIGDKNSAVQKTIHENGMIGHLEHPKDGRTDGNEGALHIRSLELKPDGVVWGKAKILDTPKGRILKVYQMEGVRWGVSSRGNGSVDSTGQVNEKDFQLETFDAVMKPSTPGAYPKAPPTGKLRENANINEFEDDWSDVAELWTVSVSFDKAALKAAGGEGKVASELGKMAARRGGRDGQISSGGRTMSFTYEFEAHDANCKGFVGMAKKKYPQAEVEFDENDVMSNSQEESDTVSPPRAAVTEEQTNAARQNVTELETLIRQDHGSLTEDAAIALAGRLLDRFGKTAAHTATGALPPGSSDRLKGTLSEKIRKIMRGLQAGPRTAASAAITESVVDGGGTTTAKDAAFRRVVQTLQERLESVSQESARLQTEAEAQTARAEDAEDRLAGEVNIRKSAVQQAAELGEKVTMLEGRLEVATQHIAEMHSDEVKDPVRRAVDEAVTANPLLERFRDILGLAQTPERVAELVTSFLPVTEAKPANAPTPRRPQLPSGKVSSGSITESASSGGRAVPRGAVLAGQILKRHNAGQPATVST